MEGFVVSARKYRPDNFDSVVGQSHVTNTLKNALLHNELAHSFLFSGPRGVGKTTCARILAKSINCANLSPLGDPCNTCDSCNGFNEGRSLNIHELDAASNNSVEDIRKIIDQVRFVPTTGKKSVFIIDEVHMLSASAFNAFLKTLEEPPPHVIFILATTEKHKILPTILSRCQKYDFRRIKVNDMADHLKVIAEKEAIIYEYPALQLIGLKADGALRDALSIFDQLVSFSGKNINYKVVLENLNILDYEYYFKATEMMQAQDHEGLLNLLNDVIEKGFEARDFLIGINEHFRNLLVAQTPKTMDLIELSDNIKKKYVSDAQQLIPSVLLNAFQLCSDAEQKLRSANNTRFLVELTLVKLAYLNRVIEIAEGNVDGPEKKKPIIKSTGLKPEKENIIEKNLVEKTQAPVSPVQLETNINPKDVSVTEIQPPPPGENQKPKKKIRKPGGFAVPNTLDDIDLSADYAKNSKEEAAKEDTPDYDISVEIPKEQFNKAFEAIKNQFKEYGKMSVASIFHIENAFLDHNKWTQIVHNESSFRQLNEEKEIVNQMRSALNVPNLSLEIKIEVLNDLNLRDKAPYTNEEKLRLMEEKNPELRKFMKKFDVIINY